ncbi:RNA polymerase sigma factor [Solirubrobacter soli]|uniref:RNA polymerase sigma factor n=1 Tax=Solirubrobacter soli TaxID=363832 RepID=UPI0003F5AA2F|nr:sigma-70 family RNA polymerase sigma factor [Solirubrobacter soli]
MHLSVHIVEYTEAQAADRRHKRTQPPRSVPTVRFRARRDARRDEDLAMTVQRAADGDAGAWKAIVKRFDGSIRMIARRHGLCEADRDEVAQRTWVAFSRHVGQLETHPALGGWLALTARRESLRVLAAARREPLVADLPEPSVPDTAHEHVEREELRHALRSAIARAPEHERRVMDLLVSEPSLSYAEISATLGIPVGSIGPIRGRCIARLRRDAELALAIHGRPVGGHDLA